MDILISLFATLLPFLVLGLIVYFFVAKATRSLNPGLPKLGKGRRSKPGGDYIADRTEGLLIAIAKGAWKLFWTIATAPFRH